MVLKKGVRRGGAPTKEKLVERSKEEELAERSKEDDLRRMISERRVKEEELVERRVKEEENKEVLDVVSPSCWREDLGATGGWDDIGEEEEEYLESTDGELYELILKKGTFVSKVKEKSVKALARLTRSLISYSRDNVEELQLLQTEEEWVGPNERASLGKFTALISFQQRRTGWMMREIMSRLRRATCTLADREKAVKVLKEENGTLRMSLEASTREQGELLNKHDPRSVVEKKDASVSAVAEVTVVETAADRAPPLPGNIPEGMKGILEALIEDKVGEILSRAGFPMVGKSGGVEGSDRCEGQTPTGHNAWSEVVKRRRRKRGPILSGGPFPLQEVGSVGGGTLRSQENAGKSGVSPPRQGMRPVVAARMAARGGSAGVGWVHAPVEALGTRPLRCYKCLEAGHYAKQCISEVDRARRCYRCGSEGHTAVWCRRRVPRCPLCVDKGGPYKHVLGGQGCSNDLPPPSRRSPGRGGEKASQDGRAASSAAG